MLVKIGDKIYDSKDDPILIILQDGDLENIYRINGNIYRLCLADKELNPEELKDLMRMEVDPDHGA